MKKLPVLIFFLAIGCSTSSTARQDLVDLMNQLFASWEGKHYAKLVDKVMDAWGPPHQVLEDGKGGKIIVWRRIKIRQDKSWSYGRKKQWTIPGKIHRTEVYRAVWADKDGIIYRWRWKGLRF